MKIYQVTALYDDAEIAYDESTNLDCARESVREQVAESFYAGCEYQLSIVVSAE